MMKTTKNLNHHSRRPGRGSSTAPHQYNSRALLPEKPVWGLRKPTKFSRISASKFENGTYYCQPRRRSWHATGPWGPSSLNVIKVRLASNTLSAEQMFSQLYLALRASRLINTQCSTPRLLELRSIDQLVLQEFLNNEWIGCISQPHLSGQEARNKNLENLRAFVCKNFIRQRLCRKADNSPAHYGILKCILVLMRSHQWSDSGCSNPYPNILHILFLF